MWMQQVNKDETERVWINVTNSDGQTISAHHPLFKIADSDAPHSMGFCKAAGTASAFEMTLKMAKAMAMTGAGCLSDSQLMNQIREDFGRA